MKKDSIIAVIIAIILLLLGVISGFLNINLDLRLMHISIGFSFIIIVLYGLKIHFNRLINKSPYNLIAWLHIIIFSFILFLSIRALRKWIKTDYFENKGENKGDNNFIVYYKNNKYNIKDFIKKHPGGEIIKKSKNKNLNDVWNKYNVSWHNNNKKVQNILNKYKIN